MSSATCTEPTVRLTGEQIGLFHEQGFLALETLTTPEEVQRLQAVYDRIFEQRKGREEGNQFDLGGSDENGKAEALPQILNPLKYAPELGETRFRVNARAIARQLLGAACQDRGAHAILKPAGHGAPTPWHQDEAYWNPEQEYRSFSVWIPLQDATLENGCLWFVPGSHRLEVLPHHPINHDPRVHGLELDDPEPYIQKAVACPLPAGGATFHLNNTLHYAGPNKTPHARRALILGFGLPSKKRSTPRRFPWLEARKTPRLERARSYQKQGK